MADVAILIFAYKRPEHLASLLGSLVANLMPKDVAVHVFIDGPRSLEESKQVESTIKIAEIYSSFMPNFHIHKASKNQGIYNQVINNGDFIFSKYRQAVFLEEDLLLSSTFFATIRSFLETYSQDPLVGCVSGHYIPGNIRKYTDASYQKLEITPHFISNYGHNLGWATWKETWEEFRKTPINEYELLAKAGRFSPFNRRASYPFSIKLGKELNSKGKSWAIRWYAYSYLSKKGTIFPDLNQVIHTGIGPSAENYRLVAKDPLLDHLFQLNQEFFSKRITSIDPIDAEQLFRQYLRIASGSTGPINALKTWLAYILDSFSHSS